ncbi:MAG TPA: sugar phosphate nucleotidyltransferase [Gemmatimonadaceae bacterium]|nr:sugar phosphate nucleotidyltransferase [Gemmatimonadaceae bacterium]
MTRWAVVLAGGVGSRFWPLSTEKRPKQLLPLVGREPMLLEQLKRLRAVAPPSRTLILTNASLVRAVAKAAPRLPAANIIAEPRPAGTAAALTWAAKLIADRDGEDATMISVHADWSIGDPEGFADALNAAATAAEVHHGLLTVGIVPTRPDPGFGYIEPGEQLESGIRRVARFVEKPSRDRAAQMRDAGYLWNSGIFAWRVGDFLDEVRTLSPEVGPALVRHGRSAKTFFAAIRKPIAVDHAVLERSQRVMVIAGDFGWDDVGTWGALQRVRSRDARGNAASGAVHLLDSTNNVVHADGGERVVLFGVDDLVVVVKHGLTLITTVDRSAELKTLVESLPKGMRDSS